MATSHARAGIYTHPAINCDQPIENVMADLRASKPAAIASRGACAGDFGRRT
jgi:hypothetical protein